MYESFRGSQTTGQMEYTTGGEQSTVTIGSTLGSSGIGINAGDFAAIVLGIMILIAIALVVAGIIVYKRKLCSGLRKKGMLII